MLSALRRRARRLLVLISLLGLATLVAWAYCGLGEYFILGSIANDFPRPPDTPRARHWPDRGWSYTDSLTILPPDLWSMRESHSPPEGTNQYEVMDFYISNIPPGWEWCSRQDGSGYLYGVTFEKGTEQVAVDTQGLQSPFRSPNYTIYVSRDNEPGRCALDIREITALGLDPIPEGSPGNRTVDWAEQRLPFPVWVPERPPKGYFMSVDSRLLGGWPYGDGDRGVEIILRNRIGQDRDVEAIFVRQFLAEGGSSHARGHRGDLHQEETIVMGELSVKVQEGVLESITGNRAWVRVEWEGDFQGNPLVYVVDSGASREETLGMVAQFSARR